MDGYHYILKGTETWNVNDRIEMFAPDESVSIDNLKPYSNYILFVYAQNKEGKHNPDLPFKIPAATEPDLKAGMPRGLEVTKNDKGIHHMSWLPPYPPTGIVGQYAVRWKPVNSEAWSGSKRVDPHGDLCDEKRNNFTT